MTEVGAVVPGTKTARQQKIVDLLTRQEVRSQSELGDLLAQDGFTVTQATLSRDLLDLDAVKVRTASGSLVYAVPGEGGDRTPRSGARACSASSSSPPSPRPTSSTCGPRRAPRSSSPRASTRPNSPLCSAP